MEDAGVEMEPEDAGVEIEVEDGGVESGGSTTVELGVSVDLLVVSTNTKLGLTGALRLCRRLVRCLVPGIVNRTIDCILSVSNSIYL